MRFFRKTGYYLWSIFELLAGIKNWKELFAIFLGKPFVGIMWLELRRKDLKIGVGSKMEAWSVKETLIDRMYEKHGTTIQPGWVVVDIGAAIGEFTVEAALAGARVHAFEPNPGSINILRQNVRANGLNGVETYNLGVWSHTDEIPLHFYNDEPLQAASGNRADAEVEDIKSTSIGVISLAELLEKVAEPINLLKLDCEGAEYEILLDQTPEVFEKIERIVMEYHDLPDGRNYRLLVEEFTKQGYQTKRHENVVHPELGYLYAERAVDSSL